jgi:uncharacterized protein YndB with AHSA1/START domain
MLKWIGGCLVLVIVLLAGGSWFAMRTMRESLEPDGSARVTIWAPQQRIYASLSNGDSIRTWMAAGNTVTTWRHGPLAVGDSIRVELSRKLGPQRPMIWRISELVPNRVVAMELMAQATGRVLGVRRDSLVAVGDSTMVVSTVVSRLLRDTTRSATAEVAGDMMLSMFRLQAKLELQGLKGRIEGPSTQKTSR